MVCSLLYAKLMLHKWLSTTFCFPDLFWIYFVVPTLFISAESHFLRSLCRGVCGKKRLDYRSQHPRGSNVSSFRKEPAEGRLAPWFTPAADFFWIFNATRLNIAGSVASRGWSRLRESDKLLRASYATFIPPVVYILPCFSQAAWLSPCNSTPILRFCRNLGFSICHG